MGDDELRDTLGRALFPLTVQVTLVYVNMGQSLPALFRGKAIGTSYISRNYKVVRANKGKGVDHITQANRVILSCVRLRSMEMIVIGTR